MTFGAMTQGADAMSHDQNVFPTGLIALYHMLPDTQITLEKFISEKQGRI